MSKPSPFAGVKLSELVSKPSPAPLDQQLFRSSPPTPVAPEQAQPQRPDPQVPGHQDTQTPRSQDATAPRPPGTQAPRHRDPQAPRPQSAGYDLTEKAEERQTLRLTSGEFRRLGAVAAALSDELGVKRVDKNDIIRCGLHRILEDYERHGQGSELVTRLKKKYR